MSPLVLQRLNRCSNFLFEVNRQSPIVRGVLPSAFSGVKVGMAQFDDAAVLITPLLHTVCMDSRTATRGLIDTMSLL